MNGRITLDANIMFGTPVITGTRIPVRTVVKYLHNGYTPEEIIDKLPQLTNTDLGLLFPILPREGEAPAEHYSRVR
ncbi:DUF433 domain-containing protein [bacterium]|nr:DUF433 domain-containing protein [bacterium]